MSGASILASLREKHAQQKRSGVQQIAVPPPRTDMSLFPPDVQRAAATLQELSTFRVRLKMAFTSFDFHFVELYLAISRISGVPVRNLHQDYSIDDMARLLSEGTVVPGTPLRVIEYKDCGLADFDGERAQAFLARLKISFDNASPVEGRLQGTVAYHGSATGCVRIVNCNDVLKTNQVRQQMQDGDILVSEMIQLNITDLVQRAGGLITDEGGVLSHAAILAREFGVPCIVGTQRATQMLKDGDCVEIRTDQACVELLHPGSHLKNAADCRSHSAKRGSE
jgi:phosphohistidine swiveling domain-containing protein